LQSDRIAWNRELAAAALAAPAASLTSVQRNQIRNLAISLSDLGNILLLQGDPDCLPHFRETLTLLQRIGDRQVEAQTAGSIGNVYLHVPGQRDLDQAEYWFQRSLSLHPDSDQRGRARVLLTLGQVAQQHFEDAREAGQAESALLEYLNAALRSCQQSLDLTPADDDEQRAMIEQVLGNIYAAAGETRQALRHYQQSIQHEEARGNIYGAGLTRYNIALLLANAGWVSDALLYARAALHNCQQAGSVADAADAERLIARLEQTLTDRPGAGH